MISSLRVLIVGLGQRGKQWLEIINKCNGVEVVAGIDPDPTCRNLARRYLPGPACKLFPILEFALRSIEADAAIVCVPVYHHAAVSMKCLDAGLAVMVEKPFAHTIEEAMQMIEESNSKGLPLIVAQNYRYSQLERTIAQAIREGVVGDIGFSQCVSHRYRPGKKTYQASIRFAQMDMASHHFDNFRAQMGCNAVSVQAKAFNPPWSSYKHGAVIAALIQMENGVQISYTGSFVSRTNSYLQRIEGERGILVTDGKHIRQRALLRHFSCRVPFVDTHKLDRLPIHLAGMHQLLSSLESAIREGKKPETSAQDNLHSLAMVIACMRSSDEGREVTISEVLT